MCCVKIRPRIEDVQNRTIKVAVTCRLVYLNNDLLYGCICKTCMVARRVLLNNQNMQSSSIMFLEY